MSPSELVTFLESIVENDVKHAVMIWGPPGVGKSSIVSQLCKTNQIGFVDVRLSQLMPSDLRGLPSPVNGVTHWNPPAFLPTEGRGVLFMDELNMAPPALQGVAQQLILDRKVGDYVLPEGWLVWAAGNRNTDRAAVYEMPGPLANRFLHLEVAPSLADFKQFAFANNVCETIIGFLTYRPDLLHKMHPSDPAWPSPRTWEMASNLVRAGLSIESAVGLGPAEEYRAFVQLRDHLPNIDAILEGKTSEAFPPDPSIRYATIAALVSRFQNTEQAVAAFQWLITNANEEWVHLFASDLFPRLRALQQYQGFASKIVADNSAKRFLADFVSLVS
ncbi:MoxR family ATPase [Motilimonas cestriensis]|uniref:MoxR family ATPase n=1 Tax=Motilimonas cestriensis TaxID=2742685 RepID=A0ABS8WFE2_9GAMM|nr:MoxR family ATPase [Motilimonas cestriensis]MCE2596351.1 MoxR family ATPase [Motilimonas cestriensis]